VVGFQAHPSGVNFVSLGLPGIALLTAVAFAAGFVNSIAGGGGLITLPALLAIGLPPYLALGTNKGQAVFGAATSVVSYGRRGEIDGARVGLGFTAGFAGACLGARGVLAIPAAPLRVVVMVLLLISSAAMLAQRKVTPTPRPLGPRAARTWLLVIAFGLGAYDGFFGPGAGSLLVMAFAAVFGDTLTRASGNAKVVNFASNLAAFISFVWSHTVVWRIALPMAAGNALGSSIGAQLAIRKGDRLVRGVTLVVVLAVVAKLAVDLARARRG
jgi:uncharacterized protein